MVTLHCKNFHRVIYVTFSSSTVHLEQFWIHIVVCQAVLVVSNKHPYTSGTLPSAKGSVELPMCKHTLGQEHSNLIIFFLSSREQTRETRAAAGCASLHLSSTLHTPPPKAELHLNGVETQDAVQWQVFLHFSESFSHCGERVRSIYYIKLAHIMAWIGSPVHLMITWPDISNIYIQYLTLLCHKFHSAQCTFWVVGLTWTLILCL